MVLFDPSLFTRCKNVTISYGQDRWQCQAHPFPPFLFQADAGAGLEVLPQAPDWEDWLRVESCFPWRAWLVQQSQPFSGGLMSVRSCRGDFFGVEA